MERHSREKGPDNDREIMERELLRPEVLRSLRQTEKKQAELIAADDRSIMLIVRREHIINSIFWDVLIDMVESEIKRRGFKFSLCVEEESESFSPSEADGFILLGQIARKYSRVLGSSRRPFVWIDGDIKYESCNQVRVNNGFGAYQMTKRAIELGHRQLAYIYSAAHLSYYERYQGMEDCVYDHRDAGVTCERIKVSIERGVDFFTEILSRKNYPTFILTCTDSIAYKIYSVAAQLLIDIPGSLSVAGFDNLHESRFLKPSLSSVDVPRVDMAVTAVELLVKHMNNPLCAHELIRVEPTAVMRESLAPAPGKR